MSYSRMDGNGAFYIYAGGDGLHVISDLNNMNEVVYKNNPAGKKNAEATIIALMHQLGLEKIKITRDRKIKNLKE